MGGGGGGGGGGGKGWEGISPQDRSWGGGGGGGGRGEGKGWEGRPSGQDLGGVTGVGRAGG